MVSKGDKVVVVRGVKVPRGTTGVAFWVGDTRYGTRVGFKDASGTTHWTAVGNLDVVTDAVVAALASPAVAGAVAATAAVKFDSVPDGVHLGAVLDKLAALDAKLDALLAVLVPVVPVVPAPFVPDGADPLDVAAFTR